MQSALEEVAASQALVQSKAALDEEALQSLLTSTRQAHEESLFESRRVIEDLRLRIRELEAQVKRMEENDE
jgi:hypothetical protein